MSGLEALQLGLARRPGLVRRVVASLLPSTLDLLTRRWDDLDAASTPDGPLAAQPGPAAGVFEAAAAATAATTPGGTASGGEPEADAAVLDVLCQGCLRELDVRSLDVPELFAAFYSEVDPDGMMATVGATKAALNRSVFDAVVARLGSG